MGRDYRLEFKKGVEKKRIIRFDRGNELVTKELDAASNDLQEAKDRMLNKRFKYATITAYYSMFHSVKAMVYFKGFREKSHYYLFVALKHLYVSSGEIKESLSKLFLDAMSLREEADYHSDFSEEGAKHSIDGAEKMFAAAKQIIKK